MEPTDNTSADNILQPQDQPSGQLPQQPAAVPPEPAVEPAQTAAVPAQPTETPAETPATPAVPSGSLPRILLVEDDDALASVYVTRLQAEGFDVRRVNNGEDALATAISYHPELVVLDVMMPKVSGFDVLDILRNTPETANVKIIMLTALSQPSDQERAKKLGADDYLVKSQVVIADVIERIRHHIGQSA